MPTFAIKNSQSFCLKNVFDTSHYLGHLVYVVLIFNPVENTQPDCHFCCRFLYTFNNNVSVDWRNNKSTPCITNFPVERHPGTGEMLSNVCRNCVTLISIEYPKKQVICDPYQWNKAVSKLMLLVHQIKNQTTMYEKNLLWKKNVVGHANCLLK